jgi:hypothetical protein
MLRNVGAQVDGIVALDDGSTDGSGELLAASPHVLELLRNPADRPRWDEPGNHRRLVAAALRHGAEWIVAVDADERLERDFRRRAERVIRRGRRLGLEAFRVGIRELWGSPRTVRVDGVWGTKRSARLFRARADARFEERALHGAKAPLQALVFNRFVAADLILYHLRMVAAADRQARRLRYETLDPDGACQSGIGYAYLTDERGIRLRPLRGRRAYDDE